MTDDEAPQSVTFSASLPPIQSAILLDGNGDGARIKLDIPRTDVGAVLLLQHFFSGESFTVTVERVTDDARNNNKSQRKSNF